MKWTAPPPQAAAGSPEGDALQVAGRGLPAGFVEALEAIHGPHKPLTFAERCAFRSQQAEAMARAEARRMPSPQLELGE